MIVAFVQFPAGGASRNEIAALFRGSAPKYQKISGLIRKYYLIAEDGENTGGVYLWESREAAERLYTREWRDYIKDRYGAEPTVKYFDCPVVVDNLSGEILPLESSEKVA
jgi:hypothetical protein